LSSIANQISGTAQGQASAKGKAGHAKAAGAQSQGKDFASAVASLSGREGDGGRNGGRLSISAGAEVKQSRLALQRAEDATGALALRDAAEGQLGDAEKVAPDQAAAVAAALGEAAEGQSDDTGTTFEDRAAALLEAAARPGHKAKGEHRPEDVKLDGEQVPDDAQAAAPADGEAPAAGTDVGNLLQLLAATNAAPVAAASGGQATISEAAGEPAGKRPSAKADLQADVASSKADADAAADGAEMQGSDTDQLFRLIRADGKGRDLDVKISGDGERASIRDANPTGPKGETVTVVDARRYIGLAQTGNSAAVTSAIAQDPEWARSLAMTGGLTHSEAAATGKVVNTLKIQMNPIELGLVTATLRLHGEELVVSLQVQTSEAYRQLSNDQDAIVKALRDQGFGVDQVSVQMSPAADRNSGAQQGDGQNQQQFSGQPQAREGGNSRQGSAEQGARNFAREEMSHEGNKSESASGAAGPQSLRSGGVYL
jgi:chemotaxis protein MotD